MSDVSHDPRKSCYIEGQGQTRYSSMPRPFAVVGGSGRRNARHFGSLAAARVGAPAGSRIFFEYQTGCGYFVEAR